MILHQLDDDPDVVAVVLDGDDPHDVGGVLSVWVGAVLVGQHQTGIRLVYLGSLQVNSVHERPLEVFDPRVLSLQQTLQLQVRLRSRENSYHGYLQLVVPVEEHDLHVHILSVLVEEILQEVRD